MVKLQQQYLLTAENIDKASDIFASACKDLKIDRKESVKQRLAFEEALLTWRAAFGEEQQFELNVYSKLFTPHIAIRCASEKSVNPFASSSNDQFAKSLLGILDKEPDYYYSKGYNTAIFRLSKPSMNPLLSLGLIIASSFIFGILGLNLLPANILETLLVYLIDPVYNTFLNVLGCVAGPLIFLSIAWGIYGIEDAATFNRLGKSLMGSFVLYALIGACVTVLTFPLFDLTLAKGGAEFSRILALLQIILDMIPPNIIEPFANGNTLQIIVLAIVMGIALLYLGKRSSSIANAIDQLNSIVNFALSIIGKLVPAFIVLVITEILWSGKLDLLINMWKLVIIEVISYLACCSVITLIIAAILKVKPLMLVKKIMPAAMIAFSTTSSAASFEALVTSCNDRFGIDESLTKFAVPLGIVTSKVIIAISYTYATLYVASIENVEISISWLVTAAFVAAVTAIATPPIPGGSSIAYTMMFSQMGLPLECVGIVLGLDTIMDFAVTGFNVYCIPLIISGVANRFGLIKRDVLES